MRIRLAVVAILTSIIALPSYAFKTAVWVPPWDSKALTTLQSNASSIHESNPVWYSWNADGTIAKNWNAENNTWRAAMSGTLLMPTIQNVIGGKFDATVVVNVLATAQSREAHAAAIAQLVKTNGFDGIDIDYERVPTTSRADFTAFATTLAQKLRAAGKKLSITVYAKTSDSQNWNGPGSQDWPALAQVADSIKIMAYDYSWSTSPAGPITPLTWLDRVATYAESVIPPSKIYIALPWYGYDWVGTNGRGITHSAAMQLAQTKNATITRDANGEPTFIYDDHTVYFQDATSYARKIEILKQKHPSIGGVAHWAAGQEDPAIWSLIRGGSPAPSTGTPTPPPASSPNTGPIGATPAPADFRVDGPALLNVQQGAAASGDYRLLAINGFNGTATVSAQILSGGFVGTITPNAVTVTASAPVTIAVNVGRNTPAGVYQLALRFTSGSIVREHLVNVVVQQVAVGRRRAA